MLYTCFHYLQCYTLFIDLHVFQYTKNQQRVTAVSRRQKFHSLDHIFSALGQSNPKTSDKEMNEHQECRNDDENRFDAATVFANLMNSCFDEYEDRTLSEDFAFSTDEGLQRAIEALNSTFNSLSTDELDELCDALKETSIPFEDYLKQHSYDHSQSVQSDSNVTSEYGSNDDYGGGYLSSEYDTSCDFHDDLDDIRTMTSFLDRNKKELDQRSPPGVTESE